MNIYKQTKNVLKMDKKITSLMYRHYLYLRRLRIQLSVLEEKNSVEGEFQ